MATGLALSSDATSGPLTTFRSIAPAYLLDEEGGAADAEPTTNDAHRTPSERSEASENFAMCRLVLMPSPSLPACRPEGPRPATSRFPYAPAYPSLRPRLSMRP